MNNNQYNFKSIATLTLILIFIIYALLTSHSFLDKVYTAENFLFQHFYFLFFGTINILLVVLVIFAFTKYGKIKIGGKNSTTEYSTFAWYAMLFSAGMGIGIMFYSVAEPLSHFYYTPLFSSNDKVSSALATTYFSWGVHAWIIYVLIGLAFAYFTYNKKLPLAFKSLFYPILKDKIYTKVGDIIDIIGAFITIFALASSLALGSMQINSGLNFLTNIEISTSIQVIIVIVIILIATISVVSGLDKGVRILSELNIRLSLVLIIAILILGPTLFIIKELFFSSANYVVNLIPASINVNYVDLSWSKQWPIFYMAWWISWSIFVGMFIAKISKGRTIKEFILSVLLIPTLLSIIWFSIIGVTSISVDANLQLSTVTNQNVSLSLFKMLDLLVSSNLLQVLLQILSLIIIVFFFITSSDSGSLIIDTLLTGKESNSISKMFWSIAQGILAIVILMIGGMKGISLIQSLLIIIAIPLTLVLIYTLITLIIQIVKDHKKEKTN